MKHREVFENSTFRRPESSFLSLLLESNFSICRAGLRGQVLCTASVWLACGFFTSRWLNVFSMWKFYEPWNWDNLYWFLITGGHGNGILGCVGHQPITAGPGTVQPSKFSVLSECRPIWWDEVTVSQSLHARQKAWAWSRTWTRARLFPGHGAGS